MGERAKREREEEGGREKETRWEAPCQSTARKRRWWKRPRRKSRPKPKRRPRHQARHCYTRYNEFHKCAAEKGEEAEDCVFFQKAYRSMCPSIWVEKWNEERESGTFAGRY